MNAKIQTIENSSKIVNRCSLFLNQMEYRTRIDEKNIEQGLMIFDIRTKDINSEID